MGLPLLTIGIPTYNRTETIFKILQQIIDRQIYSIAQILIIDDGGTDGGYEKLRVSSAFLKENIKFLRNDVNIGYARTFIRMFTECKTEYLMMTTDDDELLPNGIKQLIDYLEFERPDFVSPQFLFKDGKIFRGRKHKKNIAPKDFFPASALAPGLVYKLSACQNGINLLKEWVSSGEESALLYPQVFILATLLHAGASCQWFDIPTVQEGSNLPSKLKDSCGKPYWSFESRWRQLTSFNKLLRYLLEIKKNKAGLEMFYANQKRIFGTLIEAMIKEEPELRKAFDREAKLFYLKQIIKKVLPIAWLKRVYHELFC
ncbi:MAG: glycosyltransferase family 2 protein [bacterium]